MRQQTWSLSMPKRSYR